MKKNNENIAERIEKRRLEAEHKKFSVRNIPRAYQGLSSVVKISPERRKHPERAKTRENQPDAENGLPCSVI
ncbi:MAG: hypothetical protein WC989_00095 [Micavibrio sp.]